jgi:hypothetical protein
MCAYTAALPVFLIMSALSLLELAGAVYPQSNTTRTLFIMPALSLLELAGIVYPHSNTTRISYYTCF